MFGYSFDIFVIADEVRAGSLIFLTLHTNGGHLLFYTFKTEQKKLRLFYSLTGIEQPGSQLGYWTHDIIISSTQIY